MDRFFTRQHVIRILLIVIAIIFVIKLAYLQLIDDTYRLKGLKISNHEEIKDAPRGLIFDREGKLLVNNNSSFTLSVIPRIAEKKGFDTLYLAKLLKIPRKDLDERLKHAKKESRYYYKYAHVYRNLSPQMYAAIKEHLYRLPGFKIERSESRAYNYSSLSHTIGYIKEISKKELKRDDFYRMGDYIGKTGIEKTYEKELRGEKGAAFYLQDHKQKIVGSYLGGKADIPTVPGHNLILTIDIDLQEYCAKLMHNKRGAIVAIEPKTGEILAKVSSPGYDLNKLYGAEGGEYYKKLNTDKLNKPLFDRSVMAQYPPGSIFKLVNALIGLQEGVVTANSYKRCVRGNYIGGSRFFMKCHRHKSFIALRESIEHSCNPYYATLFRDLLHNPKYNSVQDAYQKWYDYVKSFGLGQKLGSDFPLQSKGNLPSVSYYNKKTKRRNWVALNIISIAIGQGELMVTPLQMANMVATIANRGYYYIPHVVKQVEGLPLKKEFTEKHKVGIEKEYFDFVIGGMKGVVERGTGTRARIRGISMAGKTGTVQVNGQPDNSVFIAFAPVDSPKIALIVYVERGTWGGTSAAPIAGLVVEKYLRDSISSYKKYLEKQVLEKNLLE